MLSPVIIKSRVLATQERKKLRRVFPRKNADRLKKRSHETESPSATVHGCRILPYLAYNRCASQERATQCRDFT